MVVVIPLEVPLGYLVEVVFDSDMVVRKREALPLFLR